MIMFCIDNLFWKTSEFTIFILPLLCVPTVNKKHDLRKCLFAYLNGLRPTYYYPIFIPKIYLYNN